MLVAHVAQFAQTQAVVSSWMCRHACTCFCVSTFGSALRCDWGLRSIPSCCSSCGSLQVRPLRHCCAARLGVLLVWCLHLPVKRCCAGETVAPGAGASTVSDPSCLLPACAALCRPHFWAAFVSAAAAAAAANILRIAAAVRSCPGVG
jgi:hypothetical protein